MTGDDLKQILEEGEGQFIEFKEDFSSKLAKEFVAFANASGGRIFLGIKDDNKVKGIKITNKLKSQVTDLANNCDPAINVRLEVFENILIIQIQEGFDKPYLCSGGFYLRLGANSQKLTRDEIIEIGIKEGKIRFDEQACLRFDFKDLDEYKLEYYLKLAKISNVLDVKSILNNLGVLKDGKMTNAGVLYFAKRPYDYIKSSIVRCVHFQGNDRVDILDKKEIDRGIIENIEYAVNYIKALVPVRFEIKGIKREEYPQFPEGAYREAIVNAIIHRDYFANGDVAIEKNQNIITINNPGGLSPIFKKEKFGTISYPRNRILADLLSNTYLMEKAGTGITRIKQHCEANNNKVELKDSGEYFFVNIFDGDIDGSKDKTSVSGSEKSSQKSSQKGSQKSSQKIIEYIQENSKITINELAERIGISDRAVKKQISKLKEEGVLKRIGPDKGGYWEIKNNEQDK